MKTNNSANGRSRKAGIVRKGDKGAVQNASASKSTCADGPRSKPSREDPRCGGPT